MISSQLYHPTTIFIFYFLFCIFVALSMDPDARKIEFVSQAWNQEWPYQLSLGHESKWHGQLGSIGGGPTPGRVYKGKKMTGKNGRPQEKDKWLKIIKINRVVRIVVIKGSLPGQPGNLLRIAPPKIVGKNVPKN